MTRSWQFAFNGTGLRGSADLSPRLVEGDAVVSQALMMMLGTTPGERVMRPDWGCPLHRLLFQPNDGATAGLAIHDALRSIATNPGRKFCRSMRAPIRRSPGNSI